MTANEARRDRSSFATSPALRLRQPHLRAERRGHPLPAQGIARPGHHPGHPGQRRAGPAGRRPAGHRSRPSHRQGPPPGRARRDAAPDEVGQADGELRSSRTCAPSTSSARPASRSWTAQGIESAILYPATMGTMAEHYVRGIKPLYDNLHAYNQWLQRDLGLRLPGPHLRPGRALPARPRLGRGASSTSCSARGAKFILLNAGPAYGRSPADPYFDPFWARINEAGASVAYHIGEFWYNEHIAPAWGLDPEPVFFEMSAWQWQNCWGERPIDDTLSALIFDNLFGRFPNIHVVVSEFGAEWVPHFVRHMDKSRGMGRRGPWIGRQAPSERPSAIFQRHVRVVPVPRGRRREDRRATSGSPTRSSWARTSRTARASPSRPISPTSSSPCRPSSSGPSCTTTPSPWWVGPHRVNREFHQETSRPLSI